MSLSIISVGEFGNSQLGLKAHHFESERATEGCSRSVLHKGIRGESLAHPIQLDPCEVNHYRPRDVFKGRQVIRDESWRPCVNPDRSSPYLPLPRSIIYPQSVEHSGGIGDQ